MSKIAELRYVSNKGSISHYLFLFLADNWQDFSYKAEKFAIPDHYRPYLGQSLLCLYFTIF